MPDSRLINPCVRQGIFGFWFIFHPNRDDRAWSGARWVEVRTDGCPAGDVQVCNFESEEAAREYLAGIPLQWVDL